MVNRIVIKDRDMIMDRREMRLRRLHVAARLKATHWVLLPFFLDVSSNGIF